VWTLDQLEWLGVVEADAEGDIITVRIGTPLGFVLLLGEVDLSADGRVLIARGVHMQSDAGSNGTGIVNLRTLARFVLAKVDCDEARIEGAVRTTGARPGHTPRRLRFVRADGA
jgi:hypothetical protein